MTYLQGLLVTLGIAIVIDMAIVAACVKIASDCDDMMEREKDESSKH